MLSREEGSEVLKLAADDEVPVELLPGVVVFPVDEELVGEVFVAVPFV